MEVQTHLPRMPTAIDNSKEPMQAAHVVRTAAAYFTGKTETSGRPRNEHATGDSISTCTGMPKCCIGALRVASHLCTSQPPVFPQNAQQGRIVTSYNMCT